jgi:predicted outer membrane repeat protein
MRRQLLTLHLALTAALAATAFSASATTHVVDQSAGPYTTIGPAITAASNGDTVLIMPGVYTGAGNTNLDTAGKNITVQGSGATSTFIDCEAMGPSTRGFYIHSGEDTTTVISDLCVLRGYSPNGGGIYCQNASPKIVGCIFSDCGVAYGGGVKLENSDAVLDMCHFSQCWSFVSGAALFIDNASPIIRHTLIEGCHSGFRGGAVLHYNGGGAVFRGVSFTECFTESGDGGACYFQEVSPNLISCYFSGNRADTTRGGAIFTNCDVELTNCEFEGNGSGSGGSIYCYEAQLTMAGGSCTGDTASIKGGAVCAVGAVLDIDGTLFMENEAPFGGALHLDGGTQTIANADIVGNIGFIFGGGANCWNAVATFDDCSFVDNWAGYDGGGLSGGYTILPEVTGCDFVGNEAGGQGGAVYMEEGTALGAILNSVFTENVAEAGAAICFDNGASPPVTGCTFSGNIAGLGTETARFVNSSSEVTNTILAFTVEELAASCVGTTTPSFTHCCVYGNAGGDSLCGDHVSNLFADPLFCDGPTTDVTLHDDSPCLPDGNPWSEQIGAKGAGGCGLSTGIDDPAGDSRLVLARPVPNPTGAGSTIAWSLPEPAHVTAAVYNVRGELVRALEAGPCPAGETSRTWDGCDESGRPASSGVYFIRVSTADATARRTLVLIR